LQTISPTRPFQGYAFEPGLDDDAREAIKALVMQALPDVPVRSIAEASEAESQLLRLAEAMPPSTTKDVVRLMAPASSAAAEPAAEGDAAKAVTLVMHAGEHVRALASATSLEAAWHAAHSALRPLTQAGVAWQRQTQLGHLMAAPARLGTGVLLTAEADLSYLRAAGRLEQEAAAAGLCVVGHGGALCLPPRLGRSAKEQAAAFVAALERILQLEELAREDAEGEDTADATASGAESEGATAVVAGGDDGVGDSTGAAKVKQMDPEYFYADTGEAQFLAEGGLPTSALGVQHAFGAEVQRLCNVHALGTSVVLRVAGAVAVMWNSETGEQRILRSHSGLGIGALAVHPEGTFIAVGDKGEVPVITIYSYPELRRYRVLRGGASRAFVHMAFDRHGHRLASLGAAPDYRLTVWDWRNEAVVLRTKAFSSDIWRVAFSNFAEGSLTTAGQGHIRFWQMANTFTGLKLQGQIGKFGRTELSDIAGFVEFPDGKVLSSTEWGNLLLWEGGFIKCEIARKGGKRCHVGAVDTVVLLEEGDVATAGADGHVRIWDFEALDAADRPHDSPYFELEPIAERKLGHQVHIRSLAQTEELGEDGGKTIYFAQDADGGLWRVDLAHAPTTRPPVKIETHHSGRVAGAGVCPIANVAATAGEDGRVIVYGVAAGAVLSVWQSETPVPCSSLLWPADTAALATDGRAFLVGASDGAVRLFVIASTHQLVLAQAFKPHSCAVTHLAFSSEAGLLAAVGADSTVFLCDFDAAARRFAPRVFFRMPAAATSVQFSDGPRPLLLVGGVDGVVREFVMPAGASADETRHTYEVDAEVSRTYVFRSILDRLEPRAKKGEGSGGEADDSEAEDGEEDASPSPPPEAAGPSGVAFARYGTRGDTLLVAMGGADAGYLYDCSWDLEEPLMAHKLAMGAAESRPRPALLAVTPGEEPCLVIGGHDGAVRLVDGTNRTRTLCAGLHDPDAGGVTAMAVTTDGRRLVSGGADGTVLVSALHVGGKREDGAPHDLPREDVASLASVLPSIEVQNVADIIDPQTYSIEEALQRAERDRLMQTAEERKRAEKRLVRAMRKEFEALREENARLPPSQRLPTSAFVMDPKLQSNAGLEREAELSRVRAELAWDLERHLKAYEKLYNHFKAMVDAPRIVVRAMRDHAAVSTFRLPVLSREFRRRSEVLFISTEDLNNVHDRALRVAARGKKVQMLREEDEGAAQEDEWEGPEEGQAAAPRARAAGGSSSEPDISGGESASRSTLQATARLGATTRARMEAEAAKTQQRHQRRTEIKARMDALQELKPDPDSMSEADVKLLKDMASNMGDYKLKTGEHYTVPVEERINTKRKRDQLIALRQRIHDCKLLFNRHVLTLRGRKTQARAKLQTIRESLAEVQQQLGRPPSELDELLPPPPPPTAEEDPAMRDTFTPESLRQFKVDYARQLAAERAAAAKAGGGGFGGFGGFGGGGAAGGAAGAASTTAEPAASKAEVAATPAAAAPANAANANAVKAPALDDQPQEDGAADRATPHSAASRRADSAAASSGLQLEDVRVNEEDLDPRVRIELESQRTFLLAAAAEVISTFDDMVARLLCTKRDSEVRIKFAEYMHVVYYQELVHLKEFDIRETELEERRDRKLQVGEEGDGFQTVNAPVLAPNGILTRLLIHHPLPSPSVSVLSPRTPSSPLYRSSTRAKSRCVARLQSWLCGSGS
jgi:WD40 repeat protein